MTSRTTTALAGRTGDRPGGRALGLLHGFPHRRTRQLATSFLVWSGSIVVAGGVAVAAARSWEIGLALAFIVLLVGILLTDPVLLAVVALPGALVIDRVGGSSASLSGADVFVFLGGLTSLVLIDWSTAPTLKRFMRGIVWFQAALILVVVAHPFRDNAIEWFHRWSYLGGSVLVGYVIAKSGRATQAVRLYLAGATLLGLIAIEHALTQHFIPAQWGAYQKNSLGTIMCTAILVAQIRPPWLGIGKREAWVYKLVCIGGLLASQSRQAAIILILGLGVAFFLNPELRGRSKLMLVGAIPLGVAVYFSLTINARNNPQFNSVTTRVDQLSAALHVWHLSPLFGQGMRFYNLPQFLYVTAPPNVFVDNLASTGIVGSLAFIFLVVVAMRTLYRLPYAFGTLGFVVLGAHLVDGLFDIFWIGASTIGPLIFAGLSLGIADLNGVWLPKPRARARGGVDLVPGRRAAGAGRALVPSSHRLARMADLPLVAGTRAAVRSSPVGEAARAVARLAARALPVPAVARLAARALPVPAVARLAARALPVPAVARLAARALPVPAVARPASAGAQGPS